MRTTTTMPPPMQVLLLTTKPDQKDLLLAELYELGTAGVVENERAGDGGVVVLLEAYFQEPFDAAARFAGCAPRWGEAETRDWVSEFESGWEALEVGERFWLVPHWRETAAPPPGRLALTVYPGRACGTGRHPTTQLCLIAMERRLVATAGGGTAAGSTVVDVGTGSGILCSAAARLGAGRIFGCDIDPEAVEVAAENLNRDGVAAHLWVGSLGAVRDNIADLLVANINAEGVRALAGDIRRALRPGGVAILSGFPVADRDRALEPFRIVELEDEQTLDGWMAVVLRRRAGASGR